MITNYLDLLTYDLLEKLLDIVADMYKKDIGITNFTKDLDEINHGIGNINNIDDSEFKKFENYIDDYLKDGYISSNSGGYSDITFRTREKNKSIECIGLFCFREKYSGYSVFPYLFLGVVENLLRWDYLHVV